MLSVCAPVCMGVCLALLCDNISDSISCCVGNKLVLFDSMFAFQELCIDIVQNLLTIIRIWTHVFHS